MKTISSDNIGKLIDVAWAIAQKQTMAGDVRLLQSTFEERLTDVLAAYEKAGSEDLFTPAAN